MGEVDEVDDFSWRMACVFVGVGRNILQTSLARQEQTLLMQKCIHL